MKQSTIPVASMIRNGVLLAVSSAEMIDTAPMSEAAAKEAAEVGKTVVGIARDIKNISV